jgi:hypothetical protein
MDLVSLGEGFEDYLHWFRQRVDEMSDCICDYHTVGVSDNKWKLANAAGHKVLVVVSENHQVNVEGILSIITKLDVIYKVEEKFGAGYVSFRLSDVRVIKDKEIGVVIYLGEK